MWLELDSVKKVRGFLRLEKRPVPGKGGANEGEKGGKASKKWLKRFKKVPAGSSSAS